jgi:hypothetical protein
VSVDFVTVSVTMGTMPSSEHLGGWCPGCRRIREGDEGGELCGHCGELLKPVRQMTQTERSEQAINEWCWQMQREGKWGPSPGGAAGDLGCSRSMIDNLVAAGVLERTEFNRDGHVIVLISRRSIDVAKANKVKYGQWKPRDDWHDLAAGKPGRGKQ